MIDLETVQAKAWEVCTRWPDRVNPWDEHYERCLYTGTDGVHCVVGQVLVELGVEPAAAWEGRTPDCILGLDLSGPAVLWLTDLQVAADFDPQSTTCRWAEALAIAIGEGVFTHQLLVDPAVRFGYWGPRASGEWCTHIGHERVGHGY